MRNTYLPSYLAFQLGDRKWTSLTLEERLQEVRLCIERTRTNIEIYNADRQYYKEQLHELLELKYIVLKDIKKQELKR